MFRKIKFLWYIDGSHMCNILIGSILKSIFDPNVMIFYHNYAGDVTTTMLEMLIGIFRQTFFKYDNYRNGKKDNFS